MDVQDYGSTCQRADGSFYGSPGGCKQGTETSLPDRPEAVAGKTGSISDSFGKVHESSIAANIARSAGIKESPGFEEEINEMYTRHSKPADREALQRAEKTSIENAENIVRQIKEDNPGSTITDVVHTGKLRSGDLANVVGVKGVSEHNNPADIVVKIKTANGEEKSVGVSLKVTDKLKFQDRKNDIPAANPGAGTISRSFGTQKELKRYNDTVERTVKDEGYKNKGAMSKDVKRMRQESKDGTISNADRQKLERIERAEQNARKQLRDDNITAANKMSLAQQKEFLASQTGAAHGPGAQIDNLKLTGYTNPKSTKESKVENLNNLPVSRAISQARELTFRPKSAGDSSTTQVVDEKGNVIMEFRLKPSSGRPGDSLKGSIDTIFHG